jgi:DNA primase
MEAQYQMQDPQQKTAFDQEIAKKLCTFSEEVERENYLQAVAGRYHMQADSLRKLVRGYANAGLVATSTRHPQNATMRKMAPEEAIRKVWRYLFSWLVNEPSVFAKVERFLSKEDFPSPLYERLAQELFTRLKKEGENFCVADFISLFRDKEEQQEVANALHGALPELSTKEERQKALKDLLIRVKQYGYQDAILHTEGALHLQEVIKSRKEVLEELGKTNISLD